LKSLHSNNPPQSHEEVHTIPRAVTRIAARRCSHAVALLGVSALRRPKPSTSYTAIEFLKLLTLRLGIPEFHSPPPVAVGNLPRPFGKEDPER
jgi:hypothetical protein